MICSTAMVHPNAKIHPTVKVGPYAVIGEFVELGAGCEVGAHVCLMGHTYAGEKNIFWAGSMIGGAPQDIKYKGEPTRLIIGNGNVFREMATVHVSNCLDEETRIGDEGLFMINSHIGHNAVIGNRVIIANGALVAGHVQIGDRAFISGNVTLHQFVRIGELAIVQGLSAMSCDVPPYVTACDRNAMAGLNSVGLRRAGIPLQARMELKQLYKLLFRSHLKRKEALAKAEECFHSEQAKRMIEFVKSSKRGIVSDELMLRRDLFRGIETSDPVHEKEE